MPQTIAIIGAGFSGTATAVHLLAHHGEQALEITLVNRHANLGRGVAYGTHSPSHLLNVPAGRMSLFPGKADDFLEFARGRCPNTTGASFVARSVYGEYLHARLNAAATSAPHARLTIVTGEVRALRLQPQGATLAFADGRQQQADHVVLAVGNYPPSDLPLQDHGVFRQPAYVRDPWSPGALDRVPLNRPVLLIGTGLTMVDVALELERRGFAAGLLAVSRHGLVPQTHRDLDSVPQPQLPVEILSGPANIHRYLHCVRNAVRESARHGGDWRDVVGALRPVTATLWQSLPTAERRRFLRHLQPYWDTLRHRTAPPSGARLHALWASGRLRILAGRLKELQRVADDIEIRWQARGQNASGQFRVASIVNCTGPESRLTHIADPLIRNLLAQGLMTPDSLQLGVATDSHGAVLDSTGLASDRIYYTGPLLRARDWECTAVPELRVAASRLADHLAKR